MKKKFLPALFSLIPLICFAQVGINTTTPSATLDVRAKDPTGTSSTAEGLLIPKVDRQRAQSMTGITAGTLVYINNITNGTQTGNTVNVDAVGMYEFNNSAWQKVSAQPNIYNANGTLTGNRVVTQGNRTLAFTGNAVNGFSIGGDIISVDMASKWIGVGTTNPQSFFDIRVDNKGFTGANDFNFTGYGTSVTPGIFLNSVGGTAANPANTPNATILGNLQFNPRVSNTQLFGSAMIQSTYKGNGLTNLTTLEFLTSSVKRLIIDENGRFAIGKDFADYTVDVDGDINATGVVRANGVALTSDLRLKKNVSDSRYGLNEILSLRPVTYDKKSSISSNDYTRSEVGFIAQELQKVLPSIVISDASPDKVLSVSYIELIPVLTKAIQEQQKEIEILKSSLKKIQQSATIKIE